MEHSTDGYRQKSNEGVQLLHRGPRRDALRQPLKDGNLSGTDFEGDGLKRLSELLAQVIREVRQRVEDFNWNGLRHSRIIAHRGESETKRGRVQNLDAKRGAARGV